MVATVNFKSITNVSQFYSRCTRSWLVLAIACLVFITCGWVEPECSLAQMPNSINRQNGYPTVNLQTQVSNSNYPTLTGFQNQESNGFGRGSASGASQGNQAVNPSNISDASFDSNTLDENVAPKEIMQMFGGGPEQWTSPKGMSSSIQIMILLTVLSLAPSILLMTTCFVRIVVVLGLLRQAIGAQQLPPSQVITALSIFMTMLVMAPVWNEVKNEAIVPYTTQSQGSISLEETINRGVRPLKRFMIRQVSMAENTDDIWLFFRYLPEDEQTPPKVWDDVPFKVLLPAYMISELKISFLLGFQVYLPFLVIDLVVSSIAISMGMMMLPPVIISLPFKLILFVLVDGWHLVVGMLMQSFAPYS